MWALQALGSGFNPAEDKVGLFPIARWKDVGPWKATPYLTASIGFPRYLILPWGPLKFFSPWHPRNSTSTGKGGGGHRECPTSNKRTGKKKPPILCIELCCQQNSSVVRCTGCIAFRLILRIVKYSDFEGKYFFLKCTLFGKWKKAKCNQKKKRRENKRQNHKEQNCSFYFGRERKRPKICWCLWLEWPFSSSFHLVSYKNQVIFCNILWKNTMPREWPGKGLEKEKQKQNLHRIRGAEQIFLVGSFIRNSKENLMLSIVVHHFS